MSDNKESLVLCLGYFDSVHLGHRKVIAKARELADETGCKLAVFTFDGNLRAMLSYGKDKYVYGLKERKEIFSSLKVDAVYSHTADVNFLSMGKLAFLNWLNKKYDIKGYVCGNDYTFGKFAKGNVEDLSRYAEANGQKLLLVDTEEADGKRISTSRIKKLLSDGKIEEADALLGEPFFYTGTVFKDRGVGATLGFPTANVKTEPDKQPLKAGVYAGYVTVDGARRKAVINFGSRPTFGNPKMLIEAHLLDFSEDIYGKTVKISFVRFLRDDRKFFSEEELKKQLNADVESAKELLKE